MKPFDLGSAFIKPDHPVEAGKWTTIRYTYRVGHPIDDTGCIKIAFRRVSDFGEPQFDDPEAPNYCTVSTTGDCQIEPRWDPKGHTRPWGRALFLKIVSGYLDRREEIQVVFGDTSQGSLGWQVQTFCVEWFEFKTLVDPIATYQFQELAESPGFKIIPGKAQKAVCIAPSTVIQGKPFTYSLKLEDRWGNPVDLPAEHKHAGFETPGINWIKKGDDSSGLAAESNPILVYKVEQKFKPFWADFHGQSEETIGSNPIEKYFQFGRDYALLDILGHQGNDFQVTDAFWDKINQITSEFYEPGCFVTFPGYEYSANTPLGGDRNVYFAKVGGRISRSSCELLPEKYSKFEDSATAADLFRNLSSQNEFHPFVFAHIGGRYADLKMHDPNMEVAVEIHSAWGTFEWLVEDAFHKGYRVGIVANSDGHKCRPGASYPGASTFGSYGGLTCVLAEKLDRESVYEAVKARRTYATTGNRPLINLSLALDENMNAQMGQIIEVGDISPTINVTIHATGPIEDVQVRNGLDTIAVLHTFNESDLGSRIKIIWSGAEVRGRARKASWDGLLEVRNGRFSKVIPVNFWNPDRPLAVLDDTHLSWQSITTGGTAGMILTLEDFQEAKLSLRTAQKDVTFLPSDIGMRPQVWDCGGLKKEIRAVRLPDMNKIREFTFSLPIENLKSGDNPIYIRVTQEDGHMAWTSPIYLIKSE